MYIIILFLLLFCIIDLIFYVPIKFHILIADDLFAIYIFNIPIIHISQTKSINKLKDKIPLYKIKDAQKEDIKYIESFNIDKLYLNYDIDKTNLYNYVIIFPIYGFFNSFDRLLKQNKIVFTIKKTKKYYLYALISVKLSKVLKEHLTIRRLKNERTSNKRNIKNVNE